VSRKIICSLLAEQSRNLDDTRHALLTRQEWLHGVVNSLAKDTCRRSLFKNATIRLSHETRLAHVLVIAQYWRSWCNEIDDGLRPFRIFTPGALRGPIYTAAIKRGHRCDVSASTYRARKRDRVHLPGFGACQARPRNRDQLINKHQSQHHKGMDRLQLVAHRPTTCGCLRASGSAHRALTRCQMLHLAPDGRS
jgi:hypothetical protein